MESWNWVCLSGSWKRQFQPSMKSWRNWACAIKKNSNKKPVWGLLISGYKNVNQLSFITFKETWNKETHHYNVSTDHKAYLLSEAANKIHQCRALLWRSSHDKALWSNKRTSENKDNVRELLCIWIILMFNWDMWSALVDEYFLLSPFCIC